MCIQQTTSETPLSGGRFLTNKINFVFWLNVGSIQFLTIFFLISETLREPHNRAERNNILFKSSVESLDRYFCLRYVFLLHGHSYFPRPQWFHCIHKINYLTCLVLCSASADFWSSTWNTNCAVVLVSLINYSPWEEET